MGGNEGAGVVVAAGSAPEAQALLGKRVAVTGGSSYAQYTKTSLNNPMFAVLPDDVSALEGASVFVNPLTVLGFIHTTQQEGHKAIVHTAAASQLGRMLVKQCKEEGIPLVNIVRKEEGVEVLKAIGAEFVVNSSLPSFKEDLLAAVKATGATIAFDATGGGTLAMVRTVYKYGGLDRRNNEFLPSVGVGNWSWAGWLMPFHFAKYGEEHRAASIKKAVAGLKTTFSTSFGTNLSLEDLAKSPEEYLASLQSQTDKKFVVLPNGPL